MAKANLPANQTQHATEKASEQSEKKAFKPSKKARTNLSVAPVDKGGSARPASASKEVAPAGGDDDAPGSIKAGEVALARVQVEIDALLPEQVRRINLYVPAAVATALGTLPKLLTLRKAMLELPGGADALDKLEVYCLATLYAHALTVYQDDGETALRACLNEAAPLRERLLSSAELLARFGFFDEAQVASIRRGTGYLDTAQDLTSLAALFRAAWGEVSSKTFVTKGEIERAAQLGPLLIQAFGRRQQGTDGAGKLGEAQDRLSRAYTLFFNAYDACRRAVAFLRWREGDADNFAPTLRPAVRRQRPSGDETGDSETPEAEPGSKTPGDDAPGELPSEGPPGGVLPDDTGV